MFKHRFLRRSSAMTGRLAALSLAASLCLLPAAVEKAAHAATITSEMQVSLTIRDICTMNTDAAQPQVDCSAGAPFRVYQGGYFARPHDSRAAVFAATRRESPVEIAF